jgi:hypothetical protein
LAARSKGPQRKSFSTKRTQSLIVVQMENDATPPGSSKVGWPFWIPTILTTFPFTLLFLHFVSSTESLSCWKIVMALVIGLAPAMVTGLIVQTVWAIVAAMAKGNFIIMDFFFVLLILAICAGFTWLNMRFDHDSSETQLSLVFWIILFPAIGFYVRKRIKQRDK